MTERRVFAASFGAGGSVTLDESAASHVRVLRLGPGDRVVLFDGEGHEASAEIVAIGDRVVCRVGQVRAAPARPRVVLVQALPKGTKLEEIVRATTEAGVAAIHLAITERSIARPDVKRSAARLPRLNALAREAARQSERADVPELLMPAPLEEVVARAPSTASRVVLSPRRGARWDQRDRAAETWIVIGPEGGLSEREEAELAARGWELARIEVPVLRVETAAPIAVALWVDRSATR